MAKGFNSRGMGGMGGGNMNSMIRQAQKMQQDMLKAQEELEAKTYEAGAGGGVVTATVSGKKELVSVAIDPEAVDPEDVEMLQDLIMAAIILGVFTFWLQIRFPMGLLLDMIL